MSRIAVRHSWILKFPHFYFKTNVQYAHSFESSSQPFFSVCSNSDRKSKQYSWYCQTFSDVFYPEGQKRHWTLPLPREKYFHISIPWQQFNALFLYTFSYEKVNNQLRLSLSYCPFLAFTIKFPRKIIIFFIPYYILKGLYFIFLVPRFFFPSLPDYDCKNKKIISISQISKLGLYEMPFWMYQMTKRMLDIIHQASVLQITYFIFHPSMVPVFDEKLQPIW